MFKEDSQDTASSWKKLDPESTLREINKVGKVKTKKWDDWTICKVRKNLRSAIDDIEKIFKNVDKNGQKVISHLQFKKGLRKLGIGISSNEID
jgi:hypothetical protein